MLANAQQLSPNVSSSDNCAGGTLSQGGGLASGAAFSVGTTVNSFMATDASGNTATSPFNVTVSDNEAPSITCPANINVGTDAGQCTAMVTYNVSSATIALAAAWAKAQDWQVDLHSRSERL
ncbi:MAG: HYR domain-containing protein [Bacteroidia bacterium]